MQYKCDVCHNSGSKNQTGDYLDCPACDMPMIRKALNDFVKSLGPTHPEDVALAIHQRALAMAPKQEAPKVVADDLAHEIMNSMAVHVDDWADGLGYEPSKTEVSGKALRYILSRAEPATPAAANGALTDEREMFDRMYLSMHGFHTKAELDKEWHRTGAMFCAALAAAGPDAALVALIHKAQSILAQHLPPDGPDAKTTISELLGLLDGPESRAALSGAKGN